MAFLDVFKWICLAIFGIAAIIWLLDLASLRKIADESQRKILNYALGTTLIGSMASFAATAFFDSDETPDPPGASPTQTALNTSPSVQPSRPGPTASPSEAVSPTPSPSATETFGSRQNPMSATLCGVRVPQTLADWAADELGEPPDFTCAGKQTYPSCLATLRERSRPEISSAAARECGDELADFRREFIAPVYGSKAGYQINLGDAEASLRFLTSEEAVERYDYVTAEISRMNGREWDAFVDLDRTSRFDMRACQGQNRCIAP